MNDPIEVELLGHRLNLKGAGDRARVMRLAALVQEKIEEVGANVNGATTGTKVALLAALNLADDCLRAREDAEAFREDVHNRSRVLLHEMEIHGLL